MKLAVALVVVMATWGMLMFAATSSEITQRKPPPPPPRPLPFPTPKTMPGFDLAGSTGASYSEFIGGLRAELEDPNRKPYFKVRMIKLFPRLQYMTVELKYAEGKSITLAIRMNDLYVDGYSYEYKGQLRARFLQLETPAIQKQVRDALFTGATNTDKDIGYDGSYSTLVGKAGLIDKGRRDPLVALGSPRLGTYINEITQKDPIKKPSEFKKTEARLLLIVIQMVSEAIRFRYIENKIKEVFSDGYTPDLRAIDLEPNWAKLTKAIAAADQTGQIPENILHDLRLRNADGTEQKIRNVYDIIGDMGLLHYTAPKPPPSSTWLIMHPVDNDTVRVQ